MINWAVDADLRHIRHALGNSVHECSLEDADAIFASWWAPLIDIDPILLRGKRVLCCMHGDLHRFLMTPRHRVVFDIVTTWIARSRKTRTELETLGYHAAYVPYWENTDEFSIIPRGTTSLNAMAARLGPRDDRYLIANFGRDSEGSDLSRPKLVKGPDMFAHIMEAALARNLPVEAVLAGPRRHWLRRRFDQTGVPYRLVGEVVETDDLAINTLSRDDINLLYNLVDLTVVSSRSEGGPLAVCEAPLAGCKLISTPVGMAPEILPTEAIFGSCEEAVKIIEQDIRANSLSKAYEATRTALSANNSTKPMRAALKTALTAAMGEEISATPLSGASHLSHRMRRRAKRLLMRFRPRKQQFRVMFGKNLVQPGHAYDPKRIMSLLSDQENFIEVSTAESAQIIFFEALADIPIKKPIGSKAKFFLVLARDYDGRELVKVVDNLNRVSGHEQFAGTISPSISLFTGLSKLGLDIPKPIFAPPIAKESFCEGGEHLNLISVGGSNEAELAKLSSSSTIEFKQAETLETRFNPLIHVELGDDLSAVLRARSAIDHKIPVAYRRNRDLEIIVGLGGLAFDDISQASATVTNLLHQRSVFSSLAVACSEDRQLWSTIVQSA